MSTFWFHRTDVAALSSIATVIRDVFGTSIEFDILNRATIVAIKGKLIFEAVHVPASVAKVRALFGLIVGSNNLTAADMPGLVVTATSQGWMFRTSFYGPAIGDATNPIWMTTREELLNVRSKRKLKGFGQQTLFTVTEVLTLGSLSNLHIDLSVLLHVS